MVTWTTSLNMTGGATRSVIDADGSSWNGYSLSALAQSSTNASVSGLPENQGKSNHWLIGLATGAPPSGEAYNVFCAFRGSGSSDPPPKYTTYVGTSAQDSNVSYVSTDILKIVYDGTNASFQVNGVEKYSYAISDPGGSLYAYISGYTLDSGANTITEAGGAPSSGGTRLPPPPLIARF